VAGYDLSAQGAENIWVEGAVSLSFLLRKAKEEEKRG